MSLRFLSAWWQRFRSVRKPQAASQFPLRCESLEDRCVPSTSLHSDVRPTPNSVGATITHLLGGVTFAFAPDHGAQTMAMADLNGDGKLDLVLVNANTGKGMTMLGTGGSFNTQQTFTFAPDHGAQTMAVADLNGDGKLDLVLVNVNTGKGMTMVGTGDGSFNTQQTFTFAPDRGLHTEATAELNGDARPHLIVTNP
jgi:FG-GAP-like repeat/EF hand